jgi:SAM-dependent methyltransferase
VGREILIRHLEGTGLELGPGHQPFSLPSNVKVRYVDRWDPEHSHELYPELGPEVPFLAPDIVANFDVDRLAMIEDGSEDFVVCSHVLEHLADPIGFLDEIQRVLRPGGVMILVLPDRRRTFDRDRPPTSLEHLVAEHDARVTVVDDAHVAEFLTLAGPEAAYLEQPAGTDRAEFFEWHRRRSIHVHCWTEDEFPEVLQYCVTRLAHHWDLLERYPLDKDDIEFGYVLRKSRPPFWRRRRPSF